MTLLMMENGGSRDFCGRRFALARSQRLPLQSHLRLDRQTRESRRPTRSKVPRPIRLKFTYSILVDTRGTGV